MRTEKQCQSHKMPVIWGKIRPPANRELLLHMPRLKTREPNLLIQIGLDQETKRNVLKEEAYK